MDSATAALVGVAIGSIVPVLSAWMGNRAAVRLERMRIHEARRHEANAALLRFARQLANRIFPMAEDKEEAFVEAMDGDFQKLDVAYYDEETMKILDKFEDVHVCLRHPDLVPERLIEAAFFEKELPAHIAALRKVARKHVRFS